MTSPEAVVAQGGLRGRWQNGVAAFLGVPYAAPPVGPLRLRAPQPAQPWHGTRDATRPGPAAPQPRSRLADAMGDYTQEQSEDCLTLNVWTPEETGGPKPVLVFLHGGGFMSGSGGLDWYSGAELARRGGIVVVTVNYRLGVLGFLDTGVEDERNLGVRDQIEALRWVRGNIAAFGGNPDAVTVCGQSAGAISIVAMLSGTAGRGLFHRAILQSTPAGMRPQTTEEARTRAAQLLDVLALQPDQVDRVRDLSASELLAAQQEINRRNAPVLGPVPSFQLVADDVVVAADPLATVGERGADGIPILIGTTRDEATAFRPGADREAELTESLFSGPTLRLAELLAQHGNPAWVYRFDWSAPGNPFGACHCIELPFLLGDRHAWQDAPMLAGADPDELAALTDVMRQAWASFVHKGDPGIPDWVANQPGQRAVMHLSSTPVVLKEN